MQSLLVDVDENVPKEEGAFMKVEDERVRADCNFRNLSEDELINLHINLGDYIRNEFGLWSGNDDLMSSCCKIAKMDKIHEDTASTIIIEELWKRLRESHKLRVVK